MVQEAISSVASRYGQADVGLAVGIRPWYHDGSFDDALKLLVRARDPKDNEHLLRSIEKAAMANSCRAKEVKIRRHDKANKTNSHQPKEWTSWEYVDRECSPESCMPRREHERKKLKKPQPRWVTLKLVP